MSRFHSRITTVPAGSFFLFGPQGVGKTTWAPAQARNVEVDFLMKRGRELLAVEVKATPRYSTTMLKGLRAIGELRGVVRRILAYGGTRSLRTSEAIDVWPLSRFARELADGTLWPG